MKNEILYLSKIQLIKFPPNDACPFMIDDNEFVTADMALGLTNGELMGYEKNHNVDGLVQERRNSIANALELHLSCTNPLIDGLVQERCSSIANALELRLSCTNPLI